MSFHLACLHAAEAKICPHVVEIFMPVSKKDRPKNPEIVIANISNALRRHQTTGDSMRPRTDTKSFAQQLFTTKSVERFLEHSRPLTETSDSHLLVLADKEFRSGMAAYKASGNVPVAARVILATVGAAQVYEEMKGGPQKACEDPVTLRLAESVGTTIARLSRSRNPRDRELVRTVQTLITLPTPIILRNGIFSSWQALFLHEWNGDALVKRSSVAGAALTSMVVHRNAGGWSGAPPSGGGIARASTRIVTNPFSFVYAWLQFDEARRKGRGLCHGLCPIH